MNINHTTPRRVYFYLCFALTTQLLLFGLKIARPKFKMKHNPCHCCVLLENKRLQLKENAHTGHIIRYMCSNTSECDQQMMLSEYLLFFSLKVRYVACVEKKKVVPSPLSLGCLYLLNLSKCRHAIYSISGAEKQEFSLESILLVFRCAFCLEL